MTAWHKAACCACRCNCYIGDWPEGESTLLDWSRRRKQPSSESSERSQTQLCRIHSVQVSCNNSLIIRKLPDWHDAVSEVLLGRCTQLSSQHCMYMPSSSHI